MDYKDDLYLKIWSYVPNFFFVIEDWPAAILPEKYNSRTQSQYLTRPGII